MDEKPKPLTPTQAVAAIAQHIGETGDAVKGTHAATAKMLASFHDFLSAVAARRPPSTDEFLAAVDAHGHAVDGAVRALTAAADWTSKLHAYEQREEADRQQTAQRRQRVDPIGTDRRKFVSDVAGRIARAEFKNLEPRLKHGGTPAGKQQLVEWTTGYFAHSGGKGWSYARRAVAPVVNDEHASEMADEIGRDLITMLRQESEPDELRTYLNDCRADWIETALIGQLYEQCRPAAA